MIVLFNNTFSYLDVALMFYIVTVGFACSIRNMIVSCRAILTFRSLDQSDAGKILDGTWIACIILLIGLHY